MEVKVSFPHPSLGLWPYKKRQITKKACEFISVLHDTSFHKKMKTQRNRWIFMLNFDEKQMVVGKADGTKGMWSDGTQVGDLARSVCPDRFVSCIFRNKDVPFFLFFLTLGPCACETCVLLLMMPLVSKWMIFFCCYGGSSSWQVSSG